MSSFICCLIFSPPPKKKSTCRGRLSEFLVSTLGRLQGKHPGARVLLAGDRKDLRVEAITSLDPTLKQLVREFTNKKWDTILVVILTDSHDIPQKPSILPPLQVDGDKEGKDSHHKGVQCLPRTNLSPPGRNSPGEDLGDKVSRIEDIKVWGHIGGQNLGRHEG